MIRVLPWWRPGDIYRSYRRDRLTTVYRKSGPLPRWHSALGAVWIITGWDWPRRILALRQASE